MRLIGRHLLRLAFLLASVLAAILGATSVWIHANSEFRVLDSSALGEPRSYRVYNPGSEGAVIYVLDGERWRLGLSTATLVALASWLRASEAPMVVAITTAQRRDVDLRAPRSTPASWRPTIAGRADRFDIFLAHELFPRVEGSNTHGRKRHLLGHSLSGLYAIDIATRRPGLFAGVYAFSPTFSHDLSIRHRLFRACREGLRVYANWGWESDRDTAIFSTFANEWKGDPRCQTSPPIIRSHRGVIHQLIMLTGQIEIAARYAPFNSLNTVPMGSTSHD